MATILKSKRAIILKLKHPERVTTVIPTAKVVTHKGQRLVAIPHRPDETRVLRMLGFTVPDPMRVHYGWPKASGRYDPYETQLETACFTTMHPRCFVNNAMGCVDADTEYLTPTGWARIADYTQGLVAQYIPQTGGIEFVEPQQFVKLACEDMFAVRTKYGVDQVLSPEHRMLITSRRGDKKTEVVQTHELFARQQAWVSHKKLPKSRSRIGYSEASIPTVFVAPEAGSTLNLTEAELRVQVAVIADGAFNAKTQTNWVCVRLKKQRKKERLHVLLSQAGISYDAKDCVPDGFTKFTFYAPLRIKEFGQKFWGLSSKYLSVVADEVMHWDGNVSSDKPSSRFSTFVKGSADFVQYAYTATGRTARVLQTRRFRRGKVETEYVVQVRNNGAPLGLAGTSSDGVRHPSITPTKSVDGFKYCFMVPSTFLVFRRNGCVFASGNTGKTVSSLWGYDFLRQSKQVNKVLIVCPLSTMERTWGDEIFKTFPHLSANVLYGTAQRRKKLLADKSADVYIINTDGLRIIEKDLAQRDDIDLVIIDEVAMFRNSATTRFKVMDRIANKQKPRRVWGLTGMPTPNSPTDAWAQCRLVTPQNKEVPKYFGSARDALMVQKGPFKWEPKSSANDIVLQWMQPSIRYTLDDVLELPEKVILHRFATMSDDQKRLYNAMLSKLKTEFEGGEILAVNEAIKASKLVQIACGVAYSRDGARVHIPAPSRIELLKELIEESDGKVIVFVPLTGTLEYVAEELRKDWEVGVVHGATPKAERDDIFGAFQNHDNPHVLVANPGTMSHGLTLTRATTIIWYAPIYSLDTYGQANARITRIGQKSKTRIVNISGSPIEERIYDRLTKKEGMQNLLLDMIQKQ